MKRLTGKELREAFLKFFAEKDHLILPSAPLIPRDDPTLLWINSGMAPLKAYFDGSKEAPHPRIATAQKCIRTNDIENVGKTPRHHTLFEMLGNFSLADYFKEEAIRWSWEFIIDVLELNPEQLWVTVYEEDEEAAYIWTKKIGFPSERLAYFGKEENFWEIGDGPSGPCSEIHFDRGQEYSCSAQCTIGCECERFSEIWNLVFTQFNKKPDGTYEPLPNKNIDTGMGLERVATILQGKDNNYETDLFFPYIEYLQEKSGVSYEDSSGLERAAFWVIADHIRAISFTLGDGALPGNEGRGYVIRRILRRASRYGRHLGFYEPFLHEMVPLVVEVMGDSYPELKTKKDYIVQIVELEEERFNQTIQQGLELLQEEIKDLKESKKKVLPGEKAFILYDTYGFPLDLTRDVLEEEGFSVDEVGFHQEMEEQRERARQARFAQDLGWRGTSGQQLDRVARDLPGTHFYGYEDLQGSGRILKILGEEGELPALQEGQEALVVLDSSPFYPEGGGQVGDKGCFAGDERMIKVNNTRQHEELIFHEVRVEKGKIQEGDTLELIVDQKRRQAIARNHTATHLLHQALRTVLGEQVEQAGSLVDEERLRFDFTHFKPLEKEDLEKIEAEVNARVLDNMPVEAVYTSLEKAREMGALALFQEKYTEKVRVICIGDYSSELCGGTHLSSTGEMGPLRIVSEAGIAAGVRRIEAVTGFNALRYMKEKENILEDLGRMLKAQPSELNKRLKLLLKENEDLKNRLQKAQSRSLADLAVELVQGQEKIGDYSLVAGQVEVTGPEEMRQLGDMIKDRLKSAIIALAAEREGKAMLLLLLTSDLVEKGFHAGKLINTMAREVGGGGGGKPHLAQAGGPDAQNIPQALEAIRKSIQAGER